MKADAQLPVRRLPGRAGGGRRRALLALRLVVLAALTACHQQTGPGGRAPATGGAVGTNNVQVAEDGQWTMPAKNYAATRYSGLDEINNANAGKLLRYSHEQQIL